MPRKKTQEQVISNFHEIHGDRYDYSLVEYTGSSTKVRVVCQTHGEFKITPSHHKKGVGCRKCFFESQKISKKEFIERSQQYFSDQYDYSLVTTSPQRGEKVQITCRLHNQIFFQEFKSHMRGHTGCAQCLSLLLSGPQENRGESKSKEDLKKLFIEKAKIIHGIKYDYSKFNYVNSNIKGEIICPEHGSFWQISTNHLKGSNCPVCARESQNENTFKRRCEELGVDYWRALKRRKAGLSEEKIFDSEYVRQTREVGAITIYGIKYPNLREAIRVLKPVASNRTISRWIKEGMTSEEAFSRVPNPGYSRGIIYLITHIESGKKYIGLTVQTLERRWQYHVEQANSGQIKSEESLHHAIRKFSSKAFDIHQVDEGTCKKDLENKERNWILRLETLVPNGYNISTGGVSGGSNRKKIMIDNQAFDSVEEAVIYVSETRNISISAAKKRISKERIDIKTPAKSGESLVKTKSYKAWSQIIHGAINPKSKSYIPGLEIYEPWRDFKTFLAHTGHPPQENMAFSRYDKKRGFFPDNCAWITKSEASIINAEYMIKNGKFRRNKK